MKRLALVVGLISAGVLAGCATSDKAGGGATSAKTMSGQELVQCLQPDRRVILEVSGTAPGKPKPAAKPKPGQKPKPAAKPRPEFLAFKGMAQGNIAWDPKGAVLKPEGKKELDKVIAQISKRGRGGSDTRPLTVSAVVVTGHNDRLEDRALSEARAKAVVDYIVSKGVNRKMIFWEGRGSSQPVPVTKFCS